MNDYILNLDKDHNQLKNISKWTELFNISVNLLIDYAVDSKLLNMYEIRQLFNSGLLTTAMWYTEYVGYTRQFNLLKEIFFQCKQDKLTDIMSIVQIYTTRLSTKTLYQNTYLSVFDSLIEAFGDPNNMFHKLIEIIPNYNSTDFIDGLRGILDMLPNDDSITFKTMDVTLLDVGRDSPYIITKKQGELYIKNKVYSIKAIIFILLDNKEFMSYSILARYILTSNSIIFNVNPLILE